MPQIRSANIEDSGNIARLHVDSWRTAYRGILSDSVLDNLSYAQRESMWRTCLDNIESKEFLYVAEDDDGKIVGFANGGPATDSNCGYDGELTGLYVLDSDRGLGIGSKLFGQAVETLCEDGHTSLLIWVLEKNPYRRFYQKMGGRVCSQKVTKMGEESYPVVAYGWRDLRSIVDGIAG